MKILKTSWLNGPNYWSNNRSKLIVMKLDLEKYEFLPTNTLGNFSECLKLLIPSLYEHRCSPGIEGGFFARLDEGTWLGHVIEHVALELQWLAGMPCGFGRTFGTNQEGVYQVIFSYTYQRAGLYAGQAAVELVQTLIDGNPYTQLEADITHLKQIAAEERLGPSTQAIVEAAQARNIPIYPISKSLIALGQGNKQKKIWAALSSETSSIGADIVADKHLTKQLLASHYIPTPRGHLVRSKEELDELVETLAFPLVTKPKNGNHGRGITTNITNKAALYKGFALAQSISKEVIIEEFVEGSDYRFLLVDYKVVAVAKRTPACVVGNGKQSIEELIQSVNADPRRGNQHDNFLTTIQIDSMTLELLQEQGLELTSVLPAGKVLFLKNTANLSTGGTSTDVTDKIHPANIRLAERVAKIVGLDICGIDCVAENITIPIATSQGMVVEVNASPGLRMHLSPCEGQPRNVALPIVNMLFPNQDEGRIPIAAITGTNGKTTVTTLLAKLTQFAGYSTGYTTTEGIYLNNQLIQEGDCSGPSSARVILNDPSVNFAVLECARGGILRSGLGFDHCDISIITNITSDHLGLGDIHSLDELTKVKAVVAYSTHTKGYAILNSEDDRVYGLKQSLSCNIALFGTSRNSHIQQHCDQGGLAIYIENQKIIIEKNKFLHEILTLKDIPLTYNGTATCMILNILPVMLAAFIANISVLTIKKYFKGLQSTPDLLPGRMNLFTFPNCTVMLDYAHNEGAYEQMKAYFSSLSYKKTIGIIGVAGDRRDEDIINVGALAAELFDEIIIRHDKDGRNRNNEQISQLLLQGIHSHSNKKTTIVSDETEALSYAISQAESDTFIFYTVEAVYKAIAFLQELQSKRHPLKDYA